MSKPKTNKMTVSGTIGNFHVSVRELQGTVNTTEFWFKNNTNAIITLIFPTVELFGYNFIEISPKVTYKEKTLLTTSTGIFEYQVFCHEGQEFAHASVPVLIIYPK